MAAGLQRFASSRRELVCQSAVSQALRAHGGRPLSERDFPHLQEFIPQRGSGQRRSHGSIIIMQRALRGRPAGARPEGFSTVGLREEGWKQGKRRKGLSLPGAEGGGGEAGRRRDGEAERRGQKQEQEQGARKTRGTTGGSYNPQTVMGGKRRRAL